MRASEVPLIYGTVCPGMKMAYLYNQNGTQGRMAQLLPTIFVLKKRGSPSIPLGEPLFF